MHPTVVINGIFCNKVPAGVAAGCISTWPGDKMRVIGTAGMWTAFVAVGAHGPWWWGAGDARSQPRTSALSSDARSD